MAASHIGRDTDSAGQTWAAINSALHYGNRGLKGGVTLASLLRIAGLLTEQHVRSTVERVAVSSARRSPFNLRCLAKDVNEC
jgi:hypothetical protein